MQPRSGFLCAILGASALLSACGEKPAEQPAAAAPSAKAQKPLPSGGVDQVAAVTMSGNDAPVALRFTLQSRPHTDEPVELLLSLQSTRDIDGAQIAFEPNEAVGVVSENRLFSLGRTAAGESGSYKVMIVPKKSGVLGLTVIATVDLPTGPVMRTFSIPIIVRE